MCALSDRPLCQEQDDLTTTDTVPIAGQPCLANLIKARFCAAPSKTARRVDVVLLFLFLLGVLVGHTRLTDIILLLLLLGVLIG